MTCTQINETMDPASWHDNYLCLPNGSNYKLAWASSVGSKNSLINDGYACILVNEPSDPHTWDDNYACYRTKVQDAPIIPS
jgi:hypothetical protein